MRVNQVLWAQCHSVPGHFGDIYAILRVSATEDRQLAHARYDTLSKVLVYVGRNGVEYVDVEVLE